MACCHGHREPPTALPVPQRIVQVPPVLERDTTSSFTEIVVPDEGRNHSSEGYVCLAVGTVTAVSIVSWSFIECGSKCPDVLAWCAAIREAHSIYIESIYRQLLVSTEWPECIRGIILVPDDPPTDCGVGDVVEVKGD